MPRNSQAASTVLTDVPRKKPAKKKRAASKATKNSQPKNGAEETALDDYRATNGRLEEIASQLATLEERLRIHLASHARDAQAQAYP